ncbi:MAG: dolichyl-phosphate mannose synthase [Elusimicrobia bacterium GWA2_69_24]|nr:MAG: dolichyl-phosphate mannose synthase [Elusimicrobia bacterium GWA2_69_24]
MLRGVVERALAEGLPVLVVDDGSTDGSLDSLSGLPIERRRFPVNRGKGAALLEGAAAAKRLGYEAILTLDADGQHDPAEGRLLLKTAAADWPAIVIGARRMESGGAPSSSIFGRDFSNFWVKMESGQALPDTQSGYRLYPVGFLTSRDFVSRRYSFEVEVLVRAAWTGMPVRSTPVSVTYAPGSGRVSHFHRLKDNLRLSCLHTWLVGRSLLPYPHERTFGTAEKIRWIPELMSPLDFFRRMAREHASAAELAAAVWVGIFLGSLPIMPFGAASILYVSHKLHLNKLASFGASHVCIAPFVPLFCIEIGHYLRFGRLWTEFTRRTLLLEIHHRLWEWLLGSLLLGPALGVVGAVFTYYLVRRLRAKPEPLPVSP